jgi:hypothetical protein
MLGPTDWVAVCSILSDITTRTSDYIASGVICQWDRKKVCVPVIAGRDSTDTVRVMCLGFEGGKDNPVVLESSKASGLVYSQDKSKG